MRKAIKATIGLTLLILVITAAVWTIVYFGKDVISPKSPEQTTAPEQASNTIVEPIASTTLDYIPSLEFDLEPGEFLSNPFSLSATTTFFRDRDWQVVDSGGVIIASGTIPGLVSSYYPFGEVYWYSKLPVSEDGELQVLASEEGPQIIIPVKLQTKTQTVEVYFRPAAMSNCGTVTPVKRTIVSTGDDDLNFYEAAIRELLKGPTQSEADLGLITMINKETKVIRIGKNEQGRYVADFTSDLRDPNQTDCFWNIAQEQIQKTLSTVPLPGRTLEGIILIEGQSIN